MLHIGRDLLFHVCFHLGVEHVGFADGKNPFLYKEFRVVLLQFVQQDSVFLCDIVAVGRCAPSIIPGISAMMNDLSS